MVLTLEGFSIKCYTFCNECYIIGQMLHLLWHMLQILTVTRKSRTIPQSIL